MAATDDNDVFLDSCYCCGAEGHDAYECPHEDEYVRCDQRCRALLHPTTLEEALRTIEHWRRHRYLCGCSHGY